MATTTPTITPTLDDDGSSGSGGFVVIGSVHGTASMTCRLPLRPRCEIWYVVPPRSGPLRISLFATEERKEETNDQSEATRRGYFCCA
jgi:hypothetical protein